MIAIAIGPRFALGRVCVTRNAMASIPPEEVQVALRRHSQGDWGEPDGHDRAENERALATDGRLFSACRARNGVRFYVITEAGRHGTTVLLPEDY